MSTIITITQSLQSKICNTEFIPGYGSLFLSNIENIKKKIDSNEDAK